MAVWAAGWWGGGVVDQGLVHSITGARSRARGRRLRPSSVGVVASDCGPGSCRSSVSSGQVASTSSRCQDPEQDAPGTPAKEVAVCVVHVPCWSFDSPAVHRVGRAGRCSRDGGAWQGWPQVGSVQVDRLPMHDLGSHRRGLGRHPHHGVRYLPDGQLALLPVRGVGRQPAPCLLGPEPACQPLSCAPGPCHARCWGARASASRSRISTLPPVLGSQCSGSHAPVRRGHRYCSPDPTLSVSTVQAGHDGGGRAPAAWLARTLSPGDGWLLGVLRRADVWRPRLSIPAHGVGLQHLRLDSVQLTRSASRSPAWFVRSHPAAGWLGCLVIFGHLVVWAASALGVVMVRAGGVARRLPSAGLGGVGV
jgi:hypothetical protein